MVGYVAHMVQTRNVYNVFSPMKGRDHLGDVGVREKITLTMDLKELLCVNVNWIRLAHVGSSDELLCNEPSGFGKSGYSLPAERLGFSNRTLLHIIYYLFIFKIILLSHSMLYNL
jgi:hypothetical protein